MCEVGAQVAPYARAQAAPPNFISLLTVERSHANSRDAYAFSSRAPVDRGGRPNRILQSQGACRRVTSRTAIHSSLRKQH